MPTRIAALATIPLVGLAIWGLARQIRKPQAVRPLTTAIGLVMAPITLVVNLVLLRQAAPGYLGFGLLAVGLGFGGAWGQTALLYRRGPAVVAERSVVHLGFWGLSFGLTQILATFAAARWVSGGLFAMFFATGTTWGSSFNLLLRRREVLAASPETNASEPRPATASARSRAGLLLTAALAVAVVAAVTILAGRSVEDTTEIAAVSAAGPDSDSAPATGESGSPDTVAPATSQPNSTITATTSTSMAASGSVATTPSSTTSPGFTVLVSEDFEDGTTSADAALPDLMELEVLETGQARMTAPAGVTGVLPALYPVNADEIVMQARFRVRSDDGRAGFGAVLFADRALEPTEYLLVWVDPTDGVVEFGAREDDAEITGARFALPEGASFQPAGWNEIVVTYSGAEVTAAVNGVPAGTWRTEGTHAGGHPGFALVKVARASEAHALVEEVLISGR